MCHARGLQARTGGDPTTAWRKGLCNDNGSKGCGKIRTVYSTASRPDGKRVASYGIFEIDMVH
jgi:hypothetical protein